MMKKIFKLMAIISVWVLSLQAFANELVWSTSGFKMPESAEYDATYDRYYVSNVNDGVMSQDGNGSISLIDGVGKLVSVDWVTGLHSPKGIALYKNRLYVADVKQLVVINVDNGKIIARYAAEDSKVLNGIAINKDDGSVFVSDWLGNKIYRLEDGELIVWMATEELNSPNGLWVDNSNLYVASWGSKIKKDFSTETSGNIKKISLQTKKIETLNQGGNWFNMDGIYRYSDDKWLVSDYIKGEIVLLNADGKIEKTLKLKVGAADFYYIKEKKLIVVPLMQDNQVVAYTFE